MSKALLKYATFLAFAVVSQSCGVEYRDRPVEFDGVDAEIVYGEGATIVAGRYEEQLFVPVDSGDALYVIHGFQGGTWVHLSVRVNAMPASGEITAILRDTNQNEIAAISYNLKLVRSAEGFLEAYDIPIPMPEDDESLNTLLENPAILGVFFRAGEYEVSITLPVVLLAG